MSQARQALGWPGVVWALLLGSLCVVTGCERHYFKATGALTSDGGRLFAWTRPVQGCSPDPLDGLPPNKSSTLFTLYWDNPVDRDKEVRHNAPPENLLQRLEVFRTRDGLAGSLRTTLIAPDTVLDSSVCSTFHATTSPGDPVIAGGRPTLSGTLDLDCRVDDSHLTAHVRFSGCEY